jgi:hypothetical protein
MHAVMFTAVVPMNLGNLLSCCMSMTNTNITYICSVSAFKSDTQAAHQKYRTNNAPHLSIFAGCVDAICCRVGGCIQAPDHKELWSSHEDVRLQEQFFQAGFH